MDRDKRFWTAGVFAGALLLVATTAIGAPFGGKPEADRLAGAADRAGANDSQLAWTSALAASVRAYGPNSEPTASALIGLAKSQWRAEDGDAAIVGAVRALAIVEATPNADQKLLADILDRLGDFYVSRHDVDHGEVLLQRSLDLRLKIYGPRHPETAWGFGELAAAKLRAGKSSEGVALYAQTVELDRALLAPADQRRLLHQIEFGNALINMGDMKGGEAMLRAAATDSATLPDTDPERIGALEGFGLMLVNQGRVDEAAKVYVQVVELGRKSRSLGDQADAKAVLGFIRLDQGRYEEAETIMLEGRKDFQAVKNDVLAAVSMMNAGTAAARRGDQALGMQRRLTALRELQALPNPNVVAVALVKFKLADSYAATGDLKSALQTERDAVEEIHKFRAENSTQRMTADLSLGWIMALNGDTRAGFEMARTAGLRLEDFSRRQAIAQLKTTGVRENAEALGRVLRTAQLAGDPETGFHFAQVLIETDAGRAAAAQNARLSSGSSAVADALKHRQRSMEERLKLEDAAATASADPATEARFKAIDADIATAEAVLDRDMPDYRSLTDPAPIAVAAAQARLDRGEALIVPVATDEGLFTFAITRDAAVWDHSPLTRLQVRALVERMRSGIDAGGNVRSAVDASGSTHAEATGFDRKAAFALYQAIFTEKIRVLTDHASTYTLAASDAFSPAPFAMLVTAEPRGDDNDPAALRATPWLIRKAAIQVAPSIPAMRAGADSRSGRTGFFGAGAPALSGAETPGAATTYFRGAEVDVTAVKGLAALPGAAVELRDMARALGQNHSTLLIGAEATEGAVKAADLSQARVVAFATHGLVAGDLGGLAEPALVFTPPAVGGSADDALLTASEAAQLKLDADWVILSACNTASGATGQSPGYTGLARAFMLAGGRHVLVSHWPVRDDAAARLTVDTVRASARGQTPARALQQAMLKLIADKRVPNGADPAVWAPFVVVGR